MTPNVERIRLWVDALRSGRYAQGSCALKYRATLTKGDRYCCLGVACEASGLGVWVDPTLPDETSMSYVVPGGDREIGQLPFDVAQWYGIDANPPLRLGADANLRATTLNDTMGKSFPEIADAIERTYLAPEAAK